MFDQKKAAPQETLKSRPPAQARHEEEEKDRQNHTAGHTDSGYDEEYDASVLAAA